LEVIGNEEPEIEEIAFSINGVEYTAIEGMTWWDWVETYGNGYAASSYDGGAGIKSSNGYWVIGDNGRVQTDDVIEAGYEYALEGYVEE
jgi:hypothetical protein